MGTLLHLHIWGLFMDLYMFYSVAGTEICEPRCVKLVAFTSLWVPSCFVKGCNTCLFQQIYSFVNFRGQLAQELLVERAVQFVFHIMADSLAYKIFCMFRTNMTNFCFFFKEDCLLNLHF